MRVSIGLSASVSPAWPLGWLMRSYLNNNSGEAASQAKKKRKKKVTHSCWVSSQCIISLVFAPLQVRNHTGVRGRAASGVLHEATSWPDTSGSTQGQSHLNAVTVTGEQGRLSASCVTGFLISLCHCRRNVCAADVHLLWRYLPVLHHPDGDARLQRSEAPIIC